MEEKEVDSMEQIVVGTLIIVSFMFAVGTLGYLILLGRGMSR